VRDVSERCYSYRYRNYKQTILLSLEIHSAKRGRRL
jgi:hypothetical protein